MQVPLCWLKFLHAIHTIFYDSYRYKSIIDLFLSSRVAQGCDLLIEFWSTELGICWLTICTNNEWNWIGLFIIHDCSISTDKKATVFYLFVEVMDKPASWLLAISLFLFLIGTTYSLILLGCQHLLFLVNAKPTSLDFNASPLTSVHFLLYMHVAMYISSCVWLSLAIINHNN